MVSYIYLFFLNTWFFGLISGKFAGKWTLGGNPEGKSFVTRLFPEGRGEGRGVVRTRFV